MTADINIMAAWLGVAAGVMSGVVAGLFFAGDGFLGGYQSWTRRLLRLGHVSFFGIGMLNLAYALTVDYLHWSAYHPLPSLSLIAAAVLMPAVCFIAAFFKPARHLFALPVSAVAMGVAGVIWMGLGGSL